MLTLSEKSEALLYIIDEFLWPELELKSKNLYARILYNMAQRILIQKKLIKLVTVYLSPTIYTRG